MLDPDPIRSAQRSEPVQEASAGSATPDRKKDTAERRRAHRARASVAPVLRAVAVTIAGRQAPARRRQGRSPRLLPVLALVVSAAVCAVLIGVVQVRAHFDAIAAQQEGAGFVAPPLATITPGPSGNRLISVIGDEWAAPRNTVSNRPWGLLMEQAIGVRTREFASDGGAYYSGAVGAGGAPFGTSATTIPPTTSLIVFFGGARDADDPPTDLAAAATQAIANAAKQAPDASIVVVGPVPSRPGKAEETRLASVRSVLRTVAGTARATWIDPVQQKWMDSSSLWSSTDASPSAAGNQRIADRMAAVLAPLLTRTSG